MRRRSTVRTAFWLTVVLALLLSFAIPHVLSRRERARRISCVGHIVNIGLGLRMYAADHGEKYPDSLSAISRYVAGQVLLFRCPSTKTAVGTMEDVERWGDYVYFKGFSEASPPDAIVVVCRPGNHGREGVNVVFVDGHCEWFETGRLVEYLAARQRRSNIQVEAIRR